MDDFLTKQECQQVEALVLQDDDDNHNGSCLKVPSATFQQTALDAKRTSTSWFCYYKALPTFLKKCMALGFPLECLEEPQIVEYQPQQEFSWHYDAVPPNQLDNGGQRLATLLVYLNTVPSGGGATIFRDLKSSSQENQPLTVQPKRGRACLFFPSNRQGNPDDRTLHRGQPPMNEEKRILQLWIHQRPYRAAVPPNNFQEDVRF